MPRSFRSGKEYYTVDPWTEWRADLRMAHIVARDVADARRKGHA